MAADTLPLRLLDTLPAGVLKLDHPSRDGPCTVSYFNAAARRVLPSLAPGLGLGQVFGDYDTGELLRTVRTLSPTGTGRASAPRRDGSGGLPLALAADGADATLVYLELPAGFPGPSDDHFRQFMNNAPAGAYVKDTQGRYLWVNALLTGLRAEELWLGHDDRELFPLEQAERIRANDQAVLQAGSAVSFLEQVTARGGLQSWLSYKFPLQTVAGTFLAGMSVNITRQVEANAALERLNKKLQERAAELQALMDLVPLAIYMAHDPECHRITGNQAAAALLSTPHGRNLSVTAPTTEEAPTPHRLLHHGRPLAPSEYPVQRAARGETITGEEYEIVFESGGSRHIFGYASPLLNPEGAVRGSLAVFMDITERKAAERVLRQRDVRLQLLWECAGILIRVDDPDRMVQELFRKIAPELRLDVYANYRLEPEGTLKLVSSAGLGPDTVRAFQRLQLGEAVCGRCAQLQAPVAMQHIQGGIDPLPAGVRAEGVDAYVANPLVVGGRLIGTLSFGSRRKTSFDNDELEFMETVSQYVAIAYERMRLVDELREADRRKDEFLATLAHELRNPLAPVRNAVHILKAGEASTPRVAWARDVIERQVTHMSRLLEDLLDVSRISRDKLELRRERVDLAAIVDAAMETSRPLLDAARHELTVGLRDVPLVVHGDPVRLAQVLSNLLNNAAKYTPDGGHIALSVERQDDEAVIRVSDDGIGLEPDMLRRVFDMFTQAQPALQRAQGGLGIGLSLVKGLVELHGGTVSAHSQGMNRGATFTVRLPLAPEGVVCADEPQPPAAAALGLRVLVVDDNVDSADSLASVLELDGCEVSTAYEGERALALAQAHPPDVVLLDLGMPGLNGFEVCQRLREQPWGKSAYVVALTGWGQHEDRERTRRAGFDAHLVKPVDVADLLRLLHARSSPAR